jgi:hypothetical protein
VTTPAAVAPADPLSFVLTGYTPPVVPAAKTAIVAPEFTGFCPITTSSIDSMVTRGKGVAFNGATFGSVGTYTYILAEATGKVSAKDPCAATIVDLKNSGDAGGVVTYKFDVIILTPTDATKSNGTLLYEVHNRTSTPSFAALTDSQQRLLRHSGGDPAAIILPTQGSRLQHRQFHREYLLHSDH